MDRTPTAGEPPTPSLTSLGTSLSRATTTGAAVPAPKTDGTQTLSRLRRQNRAAGVFTQDLGEDAQLPAAASVGESPGLTSWTEFLAQPADQQLLRSSAVQKQQQQHQISTEQLERFRFESLGVQVDTLTLLDFSYQSTSTHPSHRCFLKEKI